ncbi:MAG: hypothetical protein QOI74_1478 [Micromonosporaceae bacterium]|nr:hypothetical protein [Micromonosporaceae bacterium]MDT5037236.1 hypothetical protein [Micromonosporaceae bacterium]
MPANPPPSGAAVPNRHDARGRHVLDIRFGRIAAVLLIVSAVLTVGGGATAVAATRAGSGATGRAGGSGATFVGELRPEVFGPAVRALLDRRADAIHRHDLPAFLRDIDPADHPFVKAQRAEFDNLAHLPLAEFRYDVDTSARYDTMVAPAIRSRYRGGYRAIAVTVRYRIDGMDTAPVAAPWVPIFAVSDGRVRLAGVVSDPRLPVGAGGQAWETGPIAVVRSTRVVLVLSAGDTARAPEMLRMAEAGLDHVAAVRHGGWAGTVLITAVQDQRVFTTYFAGNADRTDHFAAVAVPYYAAVPDWNRKPAYAATRVVFNPREFSADPSELAHDLTHELAHVAMGPVTGDTTPLWLVEGFAEYVAYKPEQVSGLYPKRALAGFQTGTAPPVDAFYDDGRNYVLAWLACRMIAQRYGEDRLVGLYDAFSGGASPADVIRQVLGVDEATLDGQYVSYVERARGGVLP